MDRSSPIRCQGSRDDDAILHHDRNDGLSPAPTGTRKGGPPRRHLLRLPGDTDELLMVFRVLGCSDSIRIQRHRNAAKSDKLHRPGLALRFERDNE